MSSLLVEAPTRFSVGRKHLASAGFWMARREEEQEEKERIPR
jgi:hypothetical protein